MAMKVLICGGRDFDEVDRFVQGMLDFQKLHGPVTCVIEGGARGADRLARRWARSRGLPVLTVEADWDYYAKGAGPIRNGWMLKFGQPDMVVAFPGGPGTANMIKQAEMAGVDVFLA